MSKYKTEWMSERKKNLRKEIVEKSHSISIFAKFVGIMFFIYQWGAIGIQPWDALWGAAKLWVSIIVFYIIFVVLVLVYLERIG
jgi:hypothetical protein